MKFNIGDRVKWLNSNNTLYRYIIISTREQDLNTDYLESKKGTFLIKNIEKLAKNNFSTPKGFDYVICQESEYFENNDSILVKNFINVTEEELNY